MGKIKGTGRWSARRKSEIVQRLLCDEELDALSRELNVLAATLSSWREAFLVGAEANLKSHATTPEDDENVRLRMLIGDMTMRNKLLREKIRAMEKSCPLALRRSKP